MPGKLKNERELLDRMAFHGPIEDIGGGVSKSYTWSAEVTEADVWIPETGNRFIISNIIISSVGACTVTLFDEVDSSAGRICKVNLAANTITVIPFPIPRPSSDINQSLQITTSATGGDLTVFGWEDGLNVFSTTTSVTTSSSSTSATTESTSSLSVTNTTSSTSSTSATTVSTSSISASTVSTSSSSSSSSSSSTSSSSTSATTVSTSSSSHSITYL